MESKNLRKLLVIALIMMVGGTAYGQMIIENTFYGKPDPNKVSQVQRPLLDMNKYDITKSENRTVCRQKVAKAEEDEETVTLTLQLVYDENNYFCTDALVYTEEGNTFFAYMVGEKLLETEIHSGEYDLFCDFKGTSAVNPTIYIIKEKISIEKDTTIIIDSSEATNYIDFDNLRPDGSLFELDLGYYDENYNFVITDKGNVDFIDVFYSIWLNKYEKQGLLSGDRLVYNAFIEGMERGFWINDVSNRYTITRTYEFLQDKTCWINTYEINEFKSNTYKNNPNDYVKVEECFTPSNYGKNKIGYGWGPLIFDAYGTLGRLISYNETINDESLSVTLFVNSKEKYSTIPRNILISADYIDYEKEIEFRPGYFYKESQELVGSFFCIRDGKPYYMNWGQLYSVNDFCISDAFIYTNSPHPQFSYDASKKTNPFGTTVPILSLANQTYLNPYSNQNMFDLRFNYIGRLGEQRQNDFDATSFDLKYNGETVCNDYFNLQNLSQTWAGENKEAGIIDLTMVNENVEVDGFIGKNTTQVHFDQTKEDVVAPTLQMLQFKDPEGMITDRFQTASDGIMEFAGGDFDYHFNPEYWIGYFDCGEQTVAVAYSPYNKEEWSELAVEEIPENFFMPGFGYFYRGSLKDVEGQGEKGWFDLKIRLEDAAGNWQEQVISPAFRIDDKVDTGIGNNNQYTTTNKQEVYDLMGRKVGNGSRLLDNGYCNKGISIVRRANGDVRKVVNK